MAVVDPEELSYYDEWRREWGEKLSGELSVVKQPCDLLKGLLGY